MKFFLPKKNKTIEPLSKKKSYKKLFISSAVIFVLLLIVSQALITMEFINTHSFKWQSPIVFQAPLIVKRTPTIVKTPLGRKSIVPQVYADTKPYSIDQDIKDVFGQYADTAIALLNCENKAHNPNIKHVNDDSFGSTDWGVFQINDHWQGVSNSAFLTDPKINIRMAYNIFSRDGYTFKLWTCGRNLGI